MSFFGAADDLSGLPLTAITAIAMDSETTGLDVASDRVVEIAAVRLRQGALDPEDRFASLVKPGIAIPAASTEIHGISDRDVAAAEAFPAVMSDFSAWAGNAVVIGYSIGFDLAVLKAEHERHGLAWRPPRFFDLRHMVQLVAPQLPEQSLELAAKWLEVEVSGRHSAPGDAETAAKIFVALLPRLREKGILTLAQAERGCRSLTAQLDEEARAGWHGFTPNGAETESKVAAYARVDSFPYRHRVADLMSAPPLTISDGAPLRDALAVMTQKKVSSLFLGPAQGRGEDYGIITERDVLRALDAEGAAALEEPVGRFGQRPLVTVGSEEFVYRALARMADKGFRHLGVTGPEGELAGALGARDLLRQRASDAVSLGDSIESAETAAALGRIWSDLTMVARALAHEEVDARDIAAIVSRELRALTRRACELAEAEFAAVGRGAPPEPYAMLVLGSGGRGESLLAMDQDNAIVFREGEAGGPADTWFELLGRRVADILNEAGVVYCKGGVMASNQAWRKDLAGWRATFEAWISRARPEDLLSSDIFFDALPVHGDLALAEALDAEARERAKGARPFLKFLALEASRFELPLGWFGRLSLEGGRVDLKQGGIMPIFSAARVVALDQGLTVRSTPERLEAARDLGVASDQVVGNMIEAHRVLLNLILRQQLRDIDRGLPLSNKVAPAELSSSEKQRLKWALEQVSSVSDLLGTPMLG